MTAALFTEGASSVREAAAWLLGNLLEHHIGICGFCCRVCVFMCLSIRVCLFLLFDVSLYLSCMMRILLL